MEGEKTQRKSYTREFKLKVVDWLKSNGHIVSATARQFGVSISVFVIGGRATHL